MANEKRLIDANLLIGICEEIAKHEWNKRASPVSWSDAYEGFIDTIEEMPTVDAVVLPCKIGDKVYRIDKGNYHSNWKPFVEELTVTEISWKKEKYGGKDLGFAIIADGIRYKFTSIGKSVFLTRKEAEAKMDGDGNV